MNSQASIRPDLERVLRLEERRTFRTGGDDGPIYALVAHNRDLGLICDFWAGECLGAAAFHEVLEFVVGEIGGGAYRLWLSDFRFLASSFAHSSDWMIGDLMPRAFEAGIERQAVVLPEDRVLPAEYDVFHAGAHVIDELGSPRVRGFTDVVEAKRWLLE